METGFENITAMDLTSDIHLDKRTFNTNMKFSKKIKIKIPHAWAKVFDELRIYLIKNNELGEYALPSSALATYILLHYKVNDLGRLPRDFKLSIIANESDIPIQLFIQVSKLYFILDLLEKFLLTEKFQCMKFATMQD